MARGTLEQSRLEAINAILPDVGPLQSRARTFLPDMLSMQFAPDNLVPTAATCFHDCAESLREVRYGLFEYEAHRVFYREVTDPPNIAIATFFERFYLGAAASRLYAAGEQLADAVAAMFNQQPARLKRQSGKLSRFSQVGDYLHRHQASEEITRDAEGLTQSPEWQEAMKFRARTVHEQPPRFAGLGLSYRRGRQWIESSDKTKRYLPITLGSEGTEDTFEVGGNLIAATFAFLTTADKMLDAYEQVLRAHSGRREIK